MSDLFKTRVRLANCRRKNPHSQQQHLPQRMRGYGNDQTNRGELKTNRRGKAKANPLLCIFRCPQDSHIFTLTLLLL